MTATKGPPVHDRTIGLGATDSAGLQNKGWKTKVRVYRETIGELKQDEDLPDVVKAGIRLEPVVADMYAERTGTRLARVNQTVRHPEHDFIVCHPDRRVLGSAGRKIVECKTAFPRTKEQQERWGEEGSDQVQIAYLLQVQHQMAVTGADVCDVAVLLNGYDFRIYTVHRDQAVIDFIVDHAVKFWHNHVMPRIPPEPTLDQDDLDFSYPTSNGIAIMPDADAERAMLEYAAYKQLENLAGKKCKDLRPILHKALGNNERFEKATGEVDKNDKPIVETLLSYSHQSSHSWDMGRIEVQCERTPEKTYTLEELRAEFKTQKTWRVMRVKKALTAIVGPVTPGVPALNQENEQEES
jgi:putative phage-type endonuclease